MKVLAAVVASALFATTLARPARSEKVERKPATMKYREDEPVPPGYHVEDRTRTGMIVAGGILTGIGGLFLAGGISDAAKHGHWSDGGEIAAVVSVLFLAPGVPLLTFGVLTKKKVLVRDDISIAPIITREARGAAVSIRF